jgi:hypothetical protein
MIDKVIVPVAWSDSLIGIPLVPQFAAHGFSSIKASPRQQAQHRPDSAFPSSPFQRASQNHRVAANDQPRQLTLSDCNRTAK